MVSFQQNDRIVSKFKDRLIQPIVSLQPKDRILSVLRPNCSKKFEWVKSHDQASKKYSTALKLSQFSERPKNEFQYDIGFIGAGTGFNHNLPPKLP